MSLVKILLLIGFYVAASKGAFTFVKFVKLHWQKKSIDHCQQFSKVMYEAQITQESLLSSFLLVKPSWNCSDQLGPIVTFLTTKLLIVLILVEMTGIYQWKFNEQQIILLHLNYALLLLFLVRILNSPIDSSHTFKSHSVHYSLQSQGIPGFNRLRFKRAEEIPFEISVSR